MKKVHLVEAGSAEGQGQQFALPEDVQLSLLEIAGSAREGLMAIAVGAGLAVLHECMEDEVDEVVGPKGRHDAERTAKRHGHTGGEVTLGGRRVPISRPRVRTADDSAEIALESYGEFSSRDVLERVVLERILAGVSARKSHRVAEPVGVEVEEVARARRASPPCRARWCPAPAPRSTSCCPRTSATSSSPS